ncbi:MAG: tetratricopeptide repeat protein [Bacteroidia bacterium]|nr:tetratricopeptide repeat protein [Bacteroidia bacterium]
MRFNKIVLFVCTVFLITSCGVNSEKKKILDRIAANEARIFGDSTATIPDQKTGMEMIQAYTDYVNNWPKDTISAEFLFKGAEIAMNLNQSGMAIEYYNRILLSYPTFKKRPYCIFLQAFILENQMNQYDQAKARYQEFIDKYPDHLLVKDAQASIENMGKPIEELIKQWDKKNSQ